MPQYNPTGTEGDHRYETGEPFDDLGLDGVKGTKQQPAFPVGYQKPGDGYDVGEGDGKFTASRGLPALLELRCPGPSCARCPRRCPAASMTDDALHRVDLWTDGGLRDLVQLPHRRAVTWPAASPRAGATSRT